MNGSTHDRLLRCFTTVFPGAQRIPEATPDTESRWDSANHILLISVIEDEFKLSIPESVAGELLSFQNFEDYLASRELG